MTTGVALGVDPNTPRGAPYGQTWARAHPTVTSEVAERLRLLEGAFPRELRGTLYRNGPARFERGARPYGHLFDGDGMVASFAFDDAGVFYRNRFVRTREYEAEERANRILYRGFGTALPRGVRGNAFHTRFKNAANTGIVSHGGALLALWEGGLPHLLDPVSLATRGRYDFGGTLLRPRSFGSALLGRELPFSAHPKRDVRTGELVNFGLRMGLMASSLLIYRVDAAGAMKASSCVALDALWFVHDFGLTERWLVFVLCPVAFRVAPMLLGRCTPAEALAPRDAAPLRVLAVSRASIERGGPPLVIDARADSLEGFAFHVVNAFDEDDSVVVDVTWTARFPHLPSPRAADAPVLEPPRPMRLRAELATRRVTVEHEGTALFELPTIDPRASGRPHRVAWGVGAAAADAARLSAIVRLEHGVPDTARDFAPDVISPPAFVPRRGAPEGEGWLIATLFVEANDTAELLVLDATTLRTVARAKLPHVLPPHFHADWAGHSLPQRHAASQRRTHVRALYSPRNARADRDSFTD